MHLGILTSHPIQYQAPWFRALAKTVDLEVFFAHRVTAIEQGQAGFGVAFDWDVDLLSGYRHQFLPNVARRPSVNHFFGCDTPQIREAICGPSNNKELITNNRPRPFDAFIVTGWNLKSYWQAIRACRKAGVPVLVRGDSQLGTTRSILKRAIKQLTHRFGLRQFDGFLSVGQRNRQYLLHYGVPPEKIFLAPHFVDNEWFAAQVAAIRKSKIENRKSWNIPEDAFCVLFCGKFISKKRPLDLVRAAQLLLTSNSSRLAPGALPPKLHLFFVGSGELGSDLRANCNVVFDAEQGTGRKEQGARGTINQEPITDNQKPRASFAGFLNQTEISRAYVAADVLVLPSDGSETWGLVVNEAMACGLPASVSDAVGCAPDLIDDETTGFAFPVGDTVQLAQRLIAIAKMERQRFQPALAARMRAYRVETAVEGTLRAIENLRK
jgi:glycosyltransferase involved in cell wall biosynthesis